MRRDPRQVVGLGRGNDGEKESIHAHGAGAPREGEDDSRRSACHQAPLKSARTVTSAETVSASRAVVLIRLRILRPWARAPRAGVGPGANKTGAN